MSIGIISPIASPIYLTIRISFPKQMTTEFKLHTSPLYDTHRRLRSVRVPGIVERM